MTIPALSRAALDRVAERRKDETWLAQARESGQLVLVEDGRSLVTETDEGPRLVAVPAASYDGDTCLLGVDGGGTAWFSGVGPLVPSGLGQRPMSLREVGAALDDRDAGLMTTAVALAHWHATHPRCPRCGEATRVVQAGWVRHCDNDGSDHFPRTDPAVIVLVSDGGDRALLGRQPTWPRGRYSTLAGFVESGESAEAAVAREVAEESGVLVDGIVYRGSQPWPFPCSLMLGYTAVAVGGTVGTADDELEDVRWFDRSEVTAVMLPPPSSIARWLIEGWLDGRWEAAA